MSETTNNSAKLFDKKNFYLMIAGAVLIALGMLLMVGGKSDDPATFLKEGVYGTRRITVAPILIIIGFALEIAGIFWKGKSKQPA